MAYKVLIAAITGQQARFSSFYDSLIHLGGPPGTQIAIAKSGSCYVSENRETVSVEALKYDFTHVLYLDDDHVLAPDTLVRLLRRDQAIVSGLYLKREQPFVPVVYDRELPDGSVAPRFLSPMERGLVSVRAVGAGCLLVKTDVLRKLERPYWRREFLGEDVGFCQRARQAGFDVMVDLDTPVGHTFQSVLWPIYKQAGLDAGTWWTVQLSTRPGEPPMSEWPQVTPAEIALNDAGDLVSRNGHPELVR